MKPPLGVCQHCGAILAVGTCQMHDEDWEPGSKPPGVYDGHLRCFACDHLTPHKFQVMDITSEIQDALEDAGIPVVRTRFGRIVKWLKGGKAK